jgi:hypothetical protein
VLVISLPGRGGALVSEVAIFTTAQYGRPLWLTGVLGKVSKMVHGWFARSLCTGTVAMTSGEFLLDFRRVDVEMLEALLLTFLIESQGIIQQRLYNDSAVYRRGIQ